MKFIHVFIIFISLFLNSNISFANSAKQPVDCSNNPEEASKLTRVVELKDFGIKMTIPLNYRAIASHDTVMIVDNGTYESIKCHINNPGAIGASGIDFTEIRKVKGQYLYSNVYDKVPGKEIYIIWNKNQENEAHEVSLRFKTKTGVIEIRNLFDGALGENDVPSEIKYLIQLAQTIEIL